MELEVESVDLIGVEQLMNEDIFMTIAWAACKLDPIAMMGSVMKGELSTMTIADKLLDISPLACVCRMWRQYCHRFIVTNFSAEPLHNMKGHTDYLLYHYVDAVSDLSVGPICRVTNDTLALCTKLESLRLKGSPLVTDAGILPIATNLTALGITAGQGVNNLLTDKSLKMCVNLTSLDLTSNSSISDTGVRALTKLTTLNLGGGQFSYMRGFDLHVSNVSLKKLRSLTSLNLSNNQRITDSALLYLPNLVELDISYSSLITNRGLCVLTHLKTLSLRGNATVSDEGLVPLVNLTSLDLNSNQVITDNALMKLTNLLSLVLEGSVFSRPVISDYGLQRCTQLTSLVISGNSSITSDGVSSLRNLTYINVGWGTLVSDNTLARMKEDNPLLNVVQHVVFDPFIGS
jgi:hypothetical protein